ncbi:MAG: polymerase III subunit alpha, DNA polymerase III subunit alpha protein [Berkelbacteria bacterium GW2011_GWE1_39_12]|uniref:DNA polymerase III subunit alpha n=1 Tax=Berkelbacteria bacterium GW2011_GWE1_39_12 TaxID=1618337 RepID=A0A0G4B2K8_9BACT|nr:MAG: polymerase III subunit alpha, DNA polymerase III subunit alpha protein [Berkelbacteria bacterium GW2011_GWE1_39_12]
MKNFVHLHVHSHYSLLDGLGKIPDLVSRAKEMGMDTLALTDHGVMYGAIEFYQECKKQDIKPIIGVEIYVSPRKMTDKEPGIDKTPYHLVLLAQNEAGYLNLLKITTAAHLEGYYYKPRVDKAYLKKHSEGLIATTACLGGEIPSHAKNGNIKAAEDALLEYLEIFDKDHFYLELQDHPKIPEQKKANKILIHLAEKHGIGLIATNDVHYINKDDAEAQDVLLCIQTGKFLSDTNRMSMTAGGEFIDISFRSPEEMIETFKETPEAITNTVKIAESCNLEIELGKFKFPPFPLPEGETYETYLRKLIDERLPKVVDVVTPEMKERIDYEFGVIKDKGYLGYFLIVQDFFHWAKEHEIPTNTRGSAAGCCVSFALGITAPKLNPLDFNLPFERFLNPFRPSAPDIDIDIADSGRDDLIAYVTEKYGADRVAQICTFGTMAAKAAIRDVARVLGFPYDFGDYLSKLIPLSTQTHYIGIKDSINLVAELKSKYETDPDTRRTLDLAARLEGCARHASVHAAGIVIAPEEITNFTPLMRDNKGGRIVTQYEMHAVGEDGVGLIKMDFLGLANLTIIQNVLKIIKKTRNIDLNLDDIPIDDPKAFELLARGETIGVFQLESEGMRKYIKELKPTTIFDIMAMVALYRPGPMAFIPEYIMRKRNPARIKYLDPRMEKILKNSLGLIVYQDDVLMIAIELAGYNWQEVDKFRKAIGKKIVKEMSAQKEKFFSQIIERGMKEEIAIDLWTQIETFAGYGFNKSHAASYGLVAYQTAYLKSHFPSEYMAALLTSEQARDLDKVAFALQETKRMNIAVLPPDVNKSFVDFGVIPETWEISYALASIKNVGKQSAETIVEERKTNGLFKDFPDFLQRLGGKVLNKKIIEALAQAGALDSLIERNRVLVNIDIILKSISDQNKAAANQMGLFGETALPKAELHLIDVPPADKKQKLTWEKELLGMYVSEHPLEGLERLLMQAGTPIITLKEKKKDDQVTIAGMITMAKKITTKKGDPMLFAQIEDQTGKIEAVVFPRVLEKDQDKWVADKIVVVKGRISDKDGQINLIASSINILDEDQKIVETAEPTRLLIHLSKDATREKLAEVKEILANYPGELAVILKVAQNGGFTEVQTKAKVMRDYTMLQKLKDLLPNGKIIFD